MKFPAILTVIIVVLIWTVREKEPEDLNDVYSDFKQMLRESSEMCDAAIESVMQIVSDEANRKLRGFEYGNKLFDVDRLILINATESIKENEKCEEGKWWKNVDKIYLDNNLVEECFEMIEIEEHLKIILEEMVQSGKEISSIKEGFPDMIEAKCSGEEDAESCKLELLVSVESQVAELLAQASVNVKMINEIISVYKKNAIVCLGKI